MRRIFISQKNSSLNSGFGMYVLSFYLLSITHPTNFKHRFILYESLKLGLLLILIISKIKYRAFNSCETYEAMTAILGSSCKHYQDG